MNSVKLLGRLTKDIELRTEKRYGKPFTRFTIAVDREMGTGTDYIDCVSFGKVAQRLKQSTSKGSRLIVEGAWRTGKYTNTMGMTTYSNVVWVRRIDIIDWRWKTSDRLPPDISRRYASKKYPELDIADEPLDSEIKEQEQIIGEVTRDDPYMPK